MLRPATRLPAGASPKSFGARLVFTAASLSFTVGRRLSYMVLINRRWFCTVPALLNFWLALVLLGVGWNFLFVSGTSLLPKGYTSGERFKVQSTHDFFVFSIQAAGSLSSGWFLHHWKWQGVILACLPAIGLLAIILLLTRPDSRGEPLTVEG